MPFQGAGVCLSLIGTEPFNAMNGAEKMLHLHVASDSTTSAKKKTFQCFNNYRLPHHDTQMLCAGSVDLPTHVRRRIFLLLFKH